MNQEQTTIILPIYIQKNIIKILCENINRVNRREWSILPIKNDKEEIGIIIKSLSLVNKCFFNTVSNNLTVSVDFISFRDQLINDTSKLLFAPYLQQSTNKENNDDNYIIKRLKQQKQQSIPSNYKIIKYENVKELVMNMEDWGIQMQLHSELPKLINGAIKSRYINLEKIIVSFPLGSVECIDFPNIRVTTCVLDYPNQNISNIKQVDNLKLYFDTTDKSNYLDVFKSLNQIKSLYSEYYIDFKYLDENGLGDGCFKNTNKIIMNKITIESWCYLLKMVPFIQHINIQVCIDNLMYQLSRFGDCEQRITPCQCSKSPENLNFNHDWKYIVNTIKDHKHLNRLFISHNCNFSSFSLSRDQRFIPDLKNGNISFSNTLFNQFKLMLYTNTSINEFCLYNVPGFHSIDINSLNLFK